VPPHNDAHGDTPHQDSENIHVDIHLDTGGPHSDHNDHVDAPHADAPHTDVPHSDTPTHTDVPHADTPPHTDVPHSDVPEPHTDL
ncbi:hypothetical protein, partial [Rhizobium leguminosarum]|uniref:hypothetical protein n=1 Tax=Rhizobium leguminosarum TaxID=384 RepID=UPI003F9495C6